jgi:predicted nucleic acid-binding protein
MILTSSADSVVVDASLLVDAIVQTDRFARRIAGIELHAPVTIDAEMLQAFRRRWLVHQFDDREAETLITAFRTLTIIRHPVQPLVERMWAIRRNVTAYDAGYVALAESLNLPLLTRDARLSRSTGHAARIEYIA